MLVRKCDYCGEDTGEGFVPIGITVASSHPPYATNKFVLDFCRTCSKTRIDEVRLVFLRGMAETDPREAACEV
jgi:hypothetical protein